MIALIFFTLLLAKQASSSPVPKEPSKTDAKIMNCVVEVISDTLSNPSPLPISQECMEALKGDERIISMLRHQNLLREFQELAAEGANEKALQMKQNNNFKEKQLEVLKNNGNKKISSLDNSEENPAGQHRSSAEEVKMEEEIGKEKQPAARRHRYMNLVDTTTDSSSIITLRDGETARKVPIGDEPFKSTSSESESDVGPSQDQRQSEEHNAEAHEDEYTEEVGEDHVKESSDEEETHNPNEDSKDEELIYSEEPSQEDWVDEATNSDSSEVKENGKGSDEEIRSNENSERHQNSENVEEEYSSKNDGKDELSDEWEEGKQKMEELVPEKKLRKHEASGEDKLIRFENLKPHGRHGNFQHVQGNRRSHPEEVRQKDKMTIASPALRKQLDVEDKKEEEGSATRKNEEQEVESLEEIESELEAMARRLHEMRSI